MDNMKNDAERYSSETIRVLKNVQKQREEDAYNKFIEAQVKRAENEQEVGE